VGACVASAPGAAAVLSGLPGAASGVTNETGDSVGALRVPPASPSYEGTQAGAEAEQDALRRRGPRLPGTRHR